MSPIWLQQSELRSSRSQQTPSSNPLQPAPPSPPLDRKTPTNFSSPSPCLLSCNTLHPWVWASTLGPGSWETLCRGQASRESTEQFVILIYGDGAPTRSIVGTSPTELPCSFKSPLPVPDLLSPEQGLVCRQSSLQKVLSHALFAGVPRYTIVLSWLLSIPGEPLIQMTFLPSPEVFSGGPTSPGRGWAKPQEAKTWPKMFANIGSFSLHDSSEESGVPPSSWKAVRAKPATTLPPQKVNSPHKELLLQDSDITPKSVMTA